MNTIIRFGSGKSPIRLTAFLFVLLGLQLVHGQGNNAALLDFEARNLPLSQVLDRLSQLAPLNFTYNSADASFSKTIDYAARGKTAEQMLAEILSISGHDIRQIGNQMVVFPLPVQQQAASPPPPTLPAPRPDTVLRIVEVPVIVRDTLVLRETVVQRDTVVVRDTIIKEVVRDGRRDLKRLPKDIFRFEPNREDGWSVSMHYGQYYGGFANSGEDTPLLNLNKQTESSTFRHYSLGAAVNLHKKQWTFTAGAQLKGFSSRFRYDDLQRSGGFYQTDTISWYYTIVQTDTTWFPVTDSIFLPIDKSEFYYNQLNRLGYLEVYAGLAYSYFSNNTFSLYVNANVGAGFLIYRDGVLIQNVAGFPGAQYKQQDIAGTLLTYQFGTGMRYKAFDWIDLFGEITYQGHTGNLFDNYVVDKRNTAFGLKIGLYRYL